LDGVEGVQVQKIRDPIFEKYRDKKMTWTIMAAKKRRGALYLSKIGDTKGSAADQAISPHCISFISE
jgi:hypothetical protein